MCTYATWGCKRHSELCSGAGSLWHNGQDKSRWQSQEKLRPMREFHIINPLHLSVIFQIAKPEDTCTFSWKTLALSCCGRNWRKGKRHWNFQKLTDALHVSVSAKNPHNIVIILWVCFLLASKRGTADMFWLVHAFRDCDLTLPGKGLNGQHGGNVLEWGTQMFLVPMINVALHPRGVETKQLCKNTEDLTTPHMDITSSAGAGASRKIYPVWKSRVRPYWHAKLNFVGLSGGWTKQNHIWPRTLGL